MAVYSVILAGGSSHPVGDESKSIIKGQGLTASRHLCPEVTYLVVFEWFL